MVTTWKPKWMSEAEYEEQRERIAGIVRDALRATSVLCVTWRKRPGESDYLEVDLSNGRLLRVYWDPQYGMRRLTIDSVDVTGAETGLSEAVLDGLVDEVHEALCVDRLEVDHDD